MMRLENAGLTFPARQPVISHFDYAFANAARDASVGRYNGTAMSMSKARKRCQELSTPHQQQDTNGRFATMAASFASET